MALGRRMPELDALRGLAAVSVVLHHLLLCDPAIGANTRGQSGDLLLNLFKYTPLDIVFAGSQAVILFFVLSGYVLSLSFLRGKPPRYRAFLVRRICRIYPPYALAVLAAFGLCLLLGGAPRIATLSGWLNSQWGRPVSVHAMAATLAFVQGRHGDTYDPVLWTMVHEMRISLIFPALIALVAICRPRVSLPLAAICCIVGFRATIALSAHGIHVDYVETLAYGACFVVGILLARHCAEVRVWYRRRRRLARAGLLLVAVLLYTYPDTVPRVSPWAQMRSVEAILTIAGCALLLIVAQWSQTSARLLRCSAARFLGRISYSLYLTHALVLLAIIHLLWQRLPVAALVALFAVCALVVAELFNRWVEQPSIRWGRRLAVIWEGAGRRRATAMATRPTDCSRERSAFEADQVPAYADRGLA